MRQVRFQISGPGSRPARQPGILARVLFSIAAAAGLVIAALLGAFFLLAALGFFFFAMTALVVRMWLARRRFERAAKRRVASGKEPSSRPDSEIIEGEYRVVGERRQHEPGRDPGGER
jgi:predicted lipid-binding transport protein (Tim44 family)